MSPESDGEVCPPRRTPIAILTRILFRIPEIQFLMIRSLEFTTFFALVIDGAIWGETSIR